MSEKLKLELHLMLPEIPDARDACVRRLTQRLKSQDGVEHVHLLVASEDKPAMLCIHFDAEALPLPRLRQLALQNGARMTGRYGHVLLELDGIRHQRRARTVSERLSRVPGVMGVETTAAGPLRLEFDRKQVDKDDLMDVIHRTDSRIKEAIPRTINDPVETGIRTPNAAEYGTPGAVDTEPRTSQHEDRHGGPFGDHIELVSSVLSGLFLICSWMLARLTGIAGWVPLAGYIAAYFFGGFFTLREAIASIRMGRFEIDFLMLVAAAGAATLGAWAEGALLLFLFSMGHTLEHFAMGRARKAIEALASLAPETAIVVRDGAEHNTPVSDLRIGDRVVVRTNERIPADGLVVKGTSAVNQAPITGESVPVDKWPVDDLAKALANWPAPNPKHRVYAGTINGVGALEIAVAKPSSESTIARVVKMVAEAETQKSPTQRFADKFERIFVPAVIGFVVMLLFAWVVVDEPFSASFYRAMAVLVASSPCALAIATPSAVLSGVARAGRGGVLVKGGGPLENLGSLSAIAFDKTGTLTVGKPKVTDVLTHGRTTSQELLRTVVAVEKFSDHPLAHAIVSYGQERLGLESNGQPDFLEKAHSVESVTGLGITAIIDNEPVFIGQDGLFRNAGGSPLPKQIEDNVEWLERDGRTTTIVRRGNRYLGVIGLMDTPRQSAAETIGLLREIGIRRMVMLSGDNQRVADAIARQVDLDEAYGDLMPDDKVKTVLMLSQEEKVAMVGDGVNDAPAMANATVGIAMGAAASDAALEAADVALMSDNLAHLPFAVGLSRMAGRIIKQNLWLSLGMVGILVPATIFGLHIGPAVFAHEGSTLIVVLNALRLLAYRG